VDRGGSECLASLTLVLSRAVVEISTLSAGAFAQFLPVCHAELYPAQVDCQVLRGEKERKPVNRRVLSQDDLRNRHNPFYTTPLKKNLYVKGLYEVRKDSATIARNLRVFSK
jgi:hypothetical protein